MLRRFIAGLFLALSFSVVYAQSPAVLWETSTFNGTGQKYTGSSATEACAQYAQAVDAYYPSATYTLGNVNIHASGNSATCQILRNGSTSGALGATVSKIGCQAGVTTVKNFGVGWADSPTQTNPEPSTTPPVTYCDGSCTAGLDELIDCGVNQDAGPNGHYELTCNVRYLYTGQTCSQQTPDPDNPEPDPSGDPGDGDPGDGDPGGGDPGGGPGDGDPGDGDPGDGDPGNGDPGTGGEPCGGEGQPACQGSGGTGGNGPGEGNDDDGEEEGQQCGLSGQPPCGVKIDESGTASVDNMLNDVGEMHNYQRHIGGENGDGGYVKSMTDDLKNMNPGTVFGQGDWSWSFQFPTGCTPLQLSGYDITVDPCEWHSTIHDLMSMIWVIATFFGVLWIARGTF